MIFYGKDSIQRKSVLSGSWIYGYFIIYNDKSFVIKEGEITWLSDITGEMECYITEVDPDTVGRLINYADYDSFQENDKIFQGDIVAIWRNRMTDIETEKPDTVGVVVDEHSIRVKGMGRWFTQDTTRVKVIGNIYDNPELVEQKEK